jgi:hydrogenase maturation protease
VIGIGSHQGADLVGWLACKRLRASASTKHFDWQLCRTPAQLPFLMQDCEVVVIVDAVLDANPAGPVINLTWPAPLVHHRALCSSHGFNVIEALQLASTLEQLPPHTYLLGLTVMDLQQDPNAVVTKALPQLQQELNRIMDHVASINCFNL